MERSFLNFINGHLWFDFFVQFIYTYQGSKRVKLNILHVGVALKSLTVQQCHRFLGRCCVSVCVCVERSEKTGRSLTEWRRGCVEISCRDLRAMHGSVPAMFCAIS